MFNNSIDVRHFDHFSSIQIFSNGANTFFIYVFWNGWVLEIGSFIFAHIRLHESIVYTHLNIISITIQTLEYIWCERVSASGTKWRKKKMFSVHVNDRVRDAPTTHELLICNCLYFITNLETIWMTLKIRFIFLSFRFISFFDTVQ